MTCVSTTRYFRPTPSIRPQVYRFEPNTGVVQAVADDFIAPNGIELDPTYKSIYVTDTGTHTFPNKDNQTDPATIYKFDITADGKGLENRRVFAYSAIGFPDGIHTDTMVRSAIVHVSDVRQPYIVQHVLTNSRATSTAVVSKSQNAKGLKHIY